MFDNFSRMPSATFVYPLKPANEMFHTLIRILFGKWPTGGLLGLLAMKRWYRQRRPCPPCGGGDWVWEGWKGTPGEIEYKCIDWFFLLFRPFVCHLTYISLPEKVATHVMRYGLESQWRLVSPPDSAAIVCELIWRATALSIDSGKAAFTHFLLSKPCIHAFRALDSMTKSEKKNP